VAIPLADYANRLMGWTNYSGQPPALPGGLRITQHKDYIKARDSLWRAVSNLLTVRSDVFAANLYVQMGNPRKFSWNYIVVVDRSNCNAPGDQPAVILFTEVR
jgi:hypothetical protein